MGSISVVINTANNQDLIIEAIKSAHQLTSSVVVVDMKSTDETVSRALKLGATVLEFPPSRYVEPARLFGIKNAPGDWVFVLDTDERLTLELCEEIKKSIAKTKATHFRIPRKNVFAKKKWLQHGGWWPDLQTRLIQKSALIDWPARIHSTPVISGESQILTQSFLHYFHTNVDEMVKKTAIFEDVESNLLFHAGRTVSVATFFRKFFGELFRRLIKNQGFRDGSFGWLESFYQAYSKTITYLLLYEKKYHTHSEGNS